MADAPAAASMPGAAPLEESLPNALPAVVIPSLNTCELLRVTLETLLKDPAVDPERIVVVDLGSADGTLEMLASGFPAVRVVTGVPNRGYGAAVNAGARDAAGEWLLVSNSDLELHEGEAVTRLMEAAHGDPTVAVVGPRLVNPDGSPQSSAHALPGPLSLAAMFAAPLRYLPRMNDRALGRLDESAMHGPTKVGWVSGALMLVRREVFDLVHGFDEDFFMNSEEVDLCARVREAGYDVLFVPDVEVTHLGGGSTPSRVEGLAWLTRGHALYTRKHFGSAALVAAVLVAGLAYVSSLPVWAGRALIGRVALRDALAEARAYAGALAGAVDG